MTVLFERGAFDLDASIATAGAISAFALGLPAYVLIKVLAPGFFARENTLTPVRIAGISMIFNIILNIIFMQFWGHVGIALASSISAWINAVWLAFLLRRDGNLIIDKDLIIKILKIFVASGIMGSGLYLGVEYLNIHLMTAQVDKMISLAGLVISGLVSFFVFAFLIGAVNLQELKILKKLD